MKKKTIVIISLILGICLVVRLGFFVYNGLITKTIRYETPEEAFSKSGPHNSELVEVLEDKDVALIIYKSADGVFSDHIIAEDSRGWTSLDRNFHTNRDVFGSYGFIYEKDVFDKNVIYFVITLEVGEITTTITDNLDSSFQISSQILGDGSQLVYGLLVSEEEIPDDYRIYLGDQEIAFDR